MDDEDGGKHQQVQTARERQIPGCSRVSLVQGAHLESVYAVLKGLGETFAASSGFAHPLLPCFTEADSNYDSCARISWKTWIKLKPLRHSKHTSDFLWAMHDPCVAWATQHSGWVLRRLLKGQCS